MHAQVQGQGQEVGQGMVARQALVREQRWGLCLCLPVPEPTPVLVPVHADDHAPAYAPVQAPMPVPALAHTCACSLCLVTTKKPPEMYKKNPALY